MDPMPDVVLRISVHGPESCLGGLDFFACQLGLLRVSTGKLLCESGIRISKQWFQCGLTSDSDLFDVLLVQICVPRTNPAKIIT